MATSWTSPTFNTTNEYIKYNVQVTETNNNGTASDLLIVVKCWRTNEGYTTYGTGTVYVIANATSNSDDPTVQVYTQAITSLQKITSSGIVLFSKTIRVEAPSNYTVWKPIIMAKISHSQFLSVPSWNSFSITLTHEGGTPSAPTSFNISAGYGNYVGLGDTINLSWSGATGNVTGYELQYSYGNSGWQAWKTQTGTSTTVSFAGRTDINQTGAGKIIKYRVRALNGSKASAWKESNQLTMMGGMDLKVSNAWKNGSTWIKVSGSWKRVKRVWIKVNGSWKYSK